MAEFGTLMRSASEGYDAGEDRKALAESRQIGLDDKKFQAERRKTVAAREDTQYERKEDQIERQRKGKEVINKAMVHGDFGGIQDYLNEYTRDGADHYIKRNKDGSIDGILEIDGKQVKKKFDTEDDLMQYVMMVAKNDPFARLDEERKNKTAAGVKAGDRAHDMAKIDRTKAWDMQIAGLKEGKKGSKAAEQLRKVANDMENRSKSRRGQMTALGNYDMAGISANLANYDGVLGVKLHDALGMDTNEAYTKAYDMVSMLHKNAEKEAIQMFPDDDVKQTEHIRAVLQRGTAQIVASIDKRAAARQGTPAATTQPGKKTTKPTVKTPPYKQFVKDFKAKNPNATDDDAKRMYSEWFPGAQVDEKAVKPAAKPKPAAKKEGGLTERKKRETPKVTDFSFGGADKRKANLEKRAKAKEAINKYLGSEEFNKLTPNAKRKWLNKNMDKLNRANRKKARKVFSEIKDKLTKRQG